MSINSLSSASYKPAAPSAAPEDKAVQMLQKQKAILQEKIKVVSESKQDPKVKQETIQELNTQIQQKQMEKLKPDPAKVTAPEEKEDINGSSDENIDGGNTAASKYMVSAATNYSQMKTMGKVRTQLKNEARIASNSGKNPEAAVSIQDKIERIEGDIEAKSQEIDKDLKKAVKEAGKAEKSDKTENSKESVETDMKASFTEAAEDANNGAASVNEAAGAEAPASSDNIGNDCSNEIKAKDNTEQVSAGHKKKELPQPGKHIDVKI